MLMRFVIAWTASEISPFFEIRPKAGGQARSGLTKPTEMYIFPGISRPGEEPEKRLIA
jgi:hypothetical protein